MISFFRKNTPLLQLASAVRITFLFLLIGCDNSFRVAENAQPSPTPTRPIIFNTGNFTPTPSPTPTLTPSPGPTSSPLPISSPCPNCFIVSGTITYDYVPAQDGLTEVGPKLGYDAKTIRPARRVVVQALENGVPIVETTTNDLGQYALNVALGKTVTVRVRTSLFASHYQPDGILPNNCNGASWDIRVVDNTQGKASFAMDSPNSFSTNTGSANLRAPLTMSGSTYTNRAAAPFAILDTVISELELACQGKADLIFPRLFINWSANNISQEGDKSTGRITTSHFTVENDGPNLYISGQENVDTDEFDDHVIAHEFGHYLENTLYRSDSTGGQHALGDSLSPTVAFSEGFGNAISGMTFNDPVYVDTNGNTQSSGFRIRVDQTPTGDDRGIYSENSVQFFLWSLYENRDSTSQSGLFDRIHAILQNFHKTSPAFTTLQSFAAYYNQQFGGAAENLQGLWSNSIALPYNSLCVGNCTGVSDVADPFDSDNDIGSQICSTCPSPRKYRQGSGSAFPASFWSLYRTLGWGVNNPTPHDQVNFGGYSFPFNKFGAVRWYRIQGNGTPLTVSFSNLGGGISCSTDAIDIYVYHNGTKIAVNEDGSGCPSVTFNTSFAETYLIQVESPTSTQAPSWTITVGGP